MTIFFVLTGSHVAYLNFLYIPAGGRGTLINIMRNYSIFVYGKYPSSPCKCDYRGSTSAFKMFIWTRRVSIMKERRWRNLSLKSYEYFSSPWFIFPLLLPRFSIMNPLVVPSAQFWTKDTTHRQLSSKTKGQLWSPCSLFINSLALIPWRNFQMWRPPPWIAVRSSSHSGTKKTW